MFDFIFLTFRSWFKWGKVCKVWWKLDIKPVVFCLCRMCVTNCCNYWTHHILLNNLRRLALSRWVMAHVSKNKLDMFVLHSGRNLFFWHGRQKKGNIWCFHIGHGFQRMLSLCLTMVDKISIIFVSCNLYMLFYKNIETKNSPKTKNILIICWGSA